MRTVLNILNFVLGGFFTTLGWLIATVFSVILIITLPLTRSCWEITKLSFLPFGNEAIHVNELYPEKKQRAAFRQRFTAEYCLVGTLRLVVVPVAYRRRHRAVRVDYWHSGWYCQFQDRRHRTVAGGSPRGIC